MGVRPSMDGTVPQDSASLILIDRSLDLVSPTVHADNLVDRMFAALRRRPVCGEDGRPPAQELADSRSEDC